MGDTPPNPQSPDSEQPFDGPPEWLPQQPVQPPLQQPGGSESPLPPTPAGPQYKSPYPAVPPTSPPFATAGPPAAPSEPLAPQPWGPPHEAQKKGGVPAWLIALLLTGFVALSLIGVGAYLTLNADDPEAPPLATGDGVVLGDHWHAQYVIHGCGEALPRQTDADPNAIHHIHTHEDGLIHIHPSSSEFIGSGATIGAFMNEVGAELTDDRLVLADGTVFDEAQGCAGEDAVLRIARWESATAADGAPTDIFDSGLASSTFRSDLERYTIFFGPSDADIPPPPPLPEPPPAAEPPSLDLDQPLDLDDLLDLDDFEDVVIVEDGA